MKNRKMKVWFLIYCKIKKKHPNWSHKQLQNCTNYAYRRSWKYKWNIKNNKEAK